MSTVVAEQLPSIAVASVSSTNHDQSDPPTPSVSRRAVKFVDATALSDNSLSAGLSAFERESVLSPNDNNTSLSKAATPSDVAGAPSPGFASSSSASPADGASMSPAVPLPKLVSLLFPQERPTHPPPPSSSSLYPLWAGGPNARGFSAVNVAIAPGAEPSTAGIGSAASTDPQLAVFARDGTVSSLQEHQFAGDVAHPVLGFCYPEFPQGGGITAPVFESLVKQSALAAALQQDPYAIKSLPPSFSGETTKVDADGVTHTPCKPYLKEAPAMDLPLESFDLRVIYERGRTGFEDEKEFSLAVGTVIAGRYRVTEFLGEAAFSRAVQAIDLKHNMHVCVKVIRNSKDFFDQSLDEVKLLHYINTGGDPDENCVVQLYDFFYFKEHMFLICELLRDNLYEFSKFNREHESEQYFTLARLQSVTRQTLTALRYVHSLGLIHCDLKPENILIKSYSRCEVKVIDFGSSCFTTDNLTSYVQSRCYRAPEAILGCRYDGRIDVWSLGALIAELATGSVLFANETVPGMLARIASICGPFTPRMLREGRHTSRFFTKFGVIYEQFQQEGASEGDLIATLYFAQPTSLEHLVGYTDPDYVDFIRQCLTLDPHLRPTSEELLSHPFLTKTY